MHRITIGNVEITALLDTNLLMNPAHFMPAHADEFVKAYGHEANERGLYPMSITCYLLRSAGKTVLVDTGLGRRKRPGFPMGQLADSLEATGVDPSEIDLVVNTHLHIDHVGWNTIEAEDGSQKVFFPKATWIIQQNEWEYWMRPEVMEQRGNEHLRECVAPIEGRAKLVSAEVPLDEHLTFIPTPGHTPGHVAIGIASQGERAVIIGDASHHPVQLEHPDWSPAFDTDPVLSAQSRDRLFDDCVADGRTWIAGHWQHPGFGRIVGLEGKRVFQAL
jgi:glyoxylase-like metal-dependent hydrolase (beta-lactamase superfamily II)